ncbi:hypothetical protein SNEBB_006717 [Seison nebaliae]|nr:hypothetical protein SNEBB_006717 [Seison nebaliae]
MSDSRISKDKRVESVNNKKNKKLGEKSDEIKKIVIEEKGNALFFNYNTQLGPPYHVIVDTNFINISIKNKLDIYSTMMDCIYAKCIPYVTDCTIAELEKLGQRYRVALKIIKDDKFKRLPCSHKGTYADDCIVQRINEFKCYIVATCDKELQRRIRKVPGIPIMSVKSRKYTVERMPDALGIR